MKFSGKRSIFLLTCSLNQIAFISYKTARPRRCTSSMGRDTLFACSVFQAAPDGFLQGKFSMAGSALREA